VDVLPVRVRIELVQPLDGRRALFNRAVMTETYKRS
jgi:hypothetical protein